MAVRTTPIRFEKLIPGMRDKAPRSDESSPYPRRLNNIISDSNTIKQRPGLKLVHSTGGDIDRIVLEPTSSGIRKYVFRGAMLKIYNSDSDTGTQVELSSGSTITEIHYAFYRALKNPSPVYTITEAKEQYIKVATTLTKNQYTDKVVKITKGGVDEYKTITGNTTDTIFVDGTLESDYSTGATATFYDTYNTLYFTRNGNLYYLNEARTDDVDTGIDTTAIGVYAGRLFMAKDGESKAIFTDVGVMYIPRNQYITFDVGDGNVLRMHNYFESLVFIMQYGIYSINGSIPEEFMPQKRLSEDISIFGSLGSAVSNGIMYLMTSRGFENYSRTQTQEQPESRPLSFVLDDSRWEAVSRLANRRTVMVISGNTVLVQMPSYILVYDSDMSAIFGEPWFAEWSGFTISDGAYYDGKTYICVSSNVYKLDNTLHIDEPSTTITSTIESNATEYGPRDSLKKWRDFCVHYTKSGDVSATFTITDSFDNTYTDVDTKIPEKKKKFDIAISSPTLLWKLDFSGNVIVEDIEISLFPQAMYGKQHNPQ